MRIPDAGTCFASVTPVMHAQSRSPTLLQAMLFHARPAEYRDIGLSSQVSTVSSWVRLLPLDGRTLFIFFFKMSGDTARPLKRKSPPGADHPQESRASPAKSRYSRSNVGSGSHRRSRRAPSLVSSHRSKSTSSRSVNSVTDPARLSGRPLSPLVLHSVKEEIVDGSSLLGDEHPPSPSIASFALFGEPSEVMDERHDATPIPESQPQAPLEVVTPGREDQPPSGYPSPPHHVRPSRISLSYPSVHPPSPSPMANVSLPPFPAPSPAPAVQLVESQDPHPRSATPIHNSAFMQYSSASSPVVGAGLRSSTPCEFCVPHTSNILLTF